MPGDTDPGLTAGHAKPCSLTLPVPVSPNIFLPLRTADGGASPLLLVGGGADGLLLHDVRPLLGEGRDNAGVFFTGAL